MALAGYNYNRLLTITGTADGAKNPYQLKLHVYKTSGVDSGLTVYCDDYCNDDFSDIRFTQSDSDTEIDYWIESYTSGVDAYIWVEFPSIPANPDTINFYMYCGDADATTTSNGANTFSTFDDFERGNDGDAVGGSWTVGAGTCKISTTHAFSGTRSAKIFRIASGITYMSIPYAAGAGLVTYAFQIRVWKDDAAGNTFIALHGNGTKDISCYVNATEDIYASASGDTGTNTTAGAWHVYDFTDINFTTQRHDMWHDGVKIINDAVMAAPAWTNIFAVAQAANTGDSYIDNVIVRTWTTNEPTITTWGDWVNLGASAPTVTTQAADNITDTSATLHGNITATGGVNPTVRGFQYGKTSGALDHTVSETGDYGTGAYSLGVTDL
jgi:hypothetical protein